jgi:hypothetical protein
VRWIPAHCNGHRFEARKRLGISVPDARIIAGGYTARQLAAVMGVDGKTVTRWIERGWFTRSRLESNRTGSRGGDFYQISERAVRDFILG